MLLKLKFRESLTGTWQRKKCRFLPRRAVGVFVQLLSSSPQHPARVALCQFLCPGPKFQSRIYIAFRSAAPFCWCIIKHVFWKMKEADDKRESLWFPSELQSQPHFPTVYLSFPLLRLRSFIIWPPPVPSASFLPFTPIRSIFCIVLHSSSVFIFHLIVWPCLVPSFWLYLWKLKAIAAVRDECACMSRPIVHEFEVKFLTWTDELFLPRFHALCFLARGSCFIQQEFYLSSKWNPTISSFCEEAQVLLYHLSIPSCHLRLIKHLCILIEN